MNVLGLVLAGGQSHRFGSDKAVAMVDGRTLLDHAIAAITPHCDAVAISGRSSADRLALPDWPAPGLGPLGGIAAALRHAAANGFASVLSVPVDCLALPADLRARLGDAPAYVEPMPVIGLWPVSALAVLEAILTGGRDRSMRGFARAIDARPITGIAGLTNINRPADLHRAGR